MAVLWDSKRAEAACKPLFERANPAKIAKHRRIMKRLDRRSARRAEGIVLRPPTAAPSPGAALQATEIRLRGFQTLRRIFPEVPLPALISALAAVEQLPAPARAAAAARQLLLAAPCSPAEAQAKPESNSVLRPSAAVVRSGLHRSQTVSPDFPGRATVEVAAAATADPSAADAAATDEVAARTGSQQQVSSPVQPLQRTRTAPAEYEPVAEARSQTPATTATTNFYGLPTTATSFYGLPPTPVNLPWSRPVTAEVDGWWINDEEDEEDFFLSDFEGKEGEEDDEHEEGQVETDPAVDLLDASQSAASVWKAYPSQDHVLDPVPICSQRGWNHFDSGKHRWGYLRKENRPGPVNAPLLRMPVPPPEVQQAVELAQARAEADEKSRLAGEGEDLSEAEVEKSFDPLASWESLQEHFRNEYGERICKELGSPSTIKLEPAPASHQVRDRFMDTVRHVGVPPIPAYHGTAEKNISSILQKGLLVPGRDGVSVVHGSAHGVGIYTANLGAAWLSRGFCDSDKMFVCGVSDPNQTGQSSTGVDPHQPAKWTSGLGLHHRQHRQPVKPAAARVAVQMGRQVVHKESSLVRHVGDAMVVFDKANVAPLFVASGFGGYRSTATAATSSITTAWWPAAGNPNHVGRPPWVGRNQVLVPKSGEIVFVALEPEACLHSKLVKRRYEHKRKHLARRALRDEKRGNCR